MRRSNETSSCSVDRRGDQRITAMEQTSGPNDTNLLEIDDVSLKDQMLCNGVTIVTYKNPNYLMNSSRQKGDDVFKKRCCNWGR